MVFTAARVRRKVAVRLTAMHLVPVLVAQLHEQIVSVDAGIGDQDVELLHLGFGVGHQLLDRVLVGKIAGQHVHALAELAGERIERVRAGAGNRDGRALRMQRARDVAADGAARAGHQRGFAGQIEHHFVPPSEP